MFHRNSKFFNDYHFKKYKRCQCTQTSDTKCILCKENFQISTDWVCPSCKFKVYKNTEYCNSCNVNRLGELKK